MKLKSHHEEPVITQSPSSQIQVINTALQDVTNSEPFLPFPGSVLPALVALRRTHETIAQSEAFLASERAAVETERRQLEGEQTRLKDQTLLAKALKARIQSLRGELAAAEGMGPEDGLREKEEELRGKKSRYDRERKELFRALRAFIDEHLAGMLAAEELGGPVVGDMMDVDEGDLASGFNAQGKPKKARTAEDGGGVDKGQKRLDEMWGNGGGGGEGDNEEEVDKATAAGNEMKQLLQALVQQLGEAKGDNSASYVKLGRESAAARFLVRSKVAQFHPKDSKKLRLIDFGRELQG